MACDFCSSAASGAVGTLMVDYLVKPIESQLRYVFCFDNFVEELEKQGNNLKSTQTRVQRKVDEAKLQTRTQVIEEDVEAWLTKAENVLNDVQGLKARIEKNERCFRCSLNCSWRISYQLSKEMEIKTLAMSELLETSSKFDSVGHRADLPGIEFFKSEDYLASKSSISAVNEITEALKDDGINVIGVWGIGGVGKTTLVKKVGNIVKEQLFKKVIEVGVSRTQIIENIQDKIADFLHLNYENKTKEGKAEELWLRLKKEEKVLIILHNMWNELNLKEIGIPLVENRKGCKIILTTRDRRVCNHMKSQVTVSLGVLDEDEAWTLFEMNASLENAPTDIIDAAKKVAKECGGLPIALVTLAKALRSKDLKGWELAHRKLEDSRLMDIEDVQDDPDKNAYLSLKTSYDHLRSKATKRCFLLCALYPKDYLIEVEDLVKYAWGLRLYQTAHSIQEVRSQVFEAINNLKDCCLLLEHYEKRHVKMHYMVRYVALWIASNEDNCLVKKVGSENSKQKLEILLLHNYDSKTSAECFEGMQELKVLSLKKASKSNNSFFSFDALKSLTNLRVLLLDGFQQLEGISDLAKLTKLEILGLHDSELPKSVDKLGGLGNLRVFDFCECKFLSGFPSNLVGKLVKVEELHLYDPTKKATITTASLWQLNCFHNLASLSLEVTSLDFPKGFVFPRLERYRIAINTGWLEDPDSIISSRSLRISQGLPLNVISELLWNVEFLGVSKIMEKDIKCLIDSTPGSVPAATTLQNLEHVKISDCENLQVIFQMKKAENKAVLLSKLKALFLEELPAMECIWNIPAQHVSLGSLEKMVLYGCRKLKSLFSFSLAQSLRCLKELLIVDCGELEQIVEELEGNEQEISPNMNLDRSLCFPKLINLVIDYCERMEYIFPNFMAPQGLPQLQELSMERLPRLKQIRKPAKQRVKNGDLQLPQLVSVTLEGIQLSKLKEALFIKIKSLVLKEIRVNNLIPEEAPDGLNELTFLKLCECKSLEYVVDTTKEQMPNTALISNLVELHMEALDGLKKLCNGQFPNGFLPNLKKLKIERCRKLKEVLQIDEPKENQPQVLSNLEHLELRKLPELRWISKGSALYFSLQSLKVVMIFSCNKLKSLFATSFVQSLRQLQELKVEECEELETLMAELESDGELTESNSHFYPLCLPELKTIDVDKCPRLKYFLPIHLAEGLPELELVRVWNCPQLKQVFSVAEKHDIGVEHCIELPRLKALRLYYLRNLSSFGPENYFIKAPALEDLSVEECPQLMNFSIQQEVNSRVELKGKVRLFTFKEFLRNTRDLTLKRIIDQKNLIPDVDLERLTSLKLEGCEDLEYLIDTTKEQVLPTSGMFTNLEELVMKEMTGLKKLCNGQPPKGFLHNLKILKVENCRKILSLYPVAQNLQQLYVYKCDELEEVFRIDELLYNREENQAPLLSNLEYLELEFVGKLRWLLKGPTQYVSLRSLKVVKIERCNGLESLFSFSLIPSLMLLEQLCLSHCKELETVFANLESDDEPELERPCLANLKTLEITHCKTLKYILPLSLVEGFRLRKLQLYIKAPALQHLKVVYCSKLSNFTIHQDQPNQSTDLVIGVKPRESCQPTDSTTLIHLPSGYKSVSSLEKLILIDVDWLRHIWKCPTHAVATNFRELEVYMCYNLTCIFPLMLVLSLSKLRVLRISSCIRLEQIIANDDISASSSSQGHDQDEISVKSDKEKLVMFPGLQELYLEGLSKLTGFSHEGYHFVFPSLRSLEIKTCYRMTTSFTVDSTSSVHVKTEAPRLGHTRHSEDIFWERDEPTSLPPYVEESNENSSLE